MRNDAQTGRNLMTLDAESQFNSVIDIAIKERVDFVLHSGDLFERINVKNIDIQGCLQALHRLSRAEIPFIVIAGNHDRPFTKGVSSPIKYCDFIENCYSIPESGTKNLEINGSTIAIHGISYLKRDVEAEIAIRSKQLMDTSDAKYHLLASHQSLEGAKAGYEWSNTSEIPVPKTAYPSSLNYLGMGHMHRRQSYAHPDNPELTIHYPGSSIITDFGERKDKKSVSIVTLTGTECEIEYENLETRKFVEKFVELKNPEDSTVTEQLIRETVAGLFDNDTFLGIRLVGRIRLAQRRVTLTNYYRDFLPKFAGFKIYNTDPKLTWYDHEGFQVLDDEEWLKHPFEELKTAITDQTGLSDERKAKLQALGEDIITEVMEGE
jgi:DNA repair exonuclease SbcCD nuclease subunit